MPRLSLSSRLVLISLVVAFVLVGVAGSIRDGKPTAPDAAGPTPTNLALGPTPTPTVTATEGPAELVSQPPQPTIFAPATVAPQGTSSPKPTDTARPTDAARPTTPPKPPSASTLVGLITQLPQAAEDRTGYSRDLFRLWIDADGDGCDTRKEVLINEAVVAPQVGASCSLTGGEWVSPYDGVVVTNASDLDIDHMVPLAEAWDSGASAWTSQRRQDYANDLGVPWSLIAVTASSNRSKGDKDPAEWLPPLASDRCVYVVDWVSVKVRWHLTVDQPSATRCSNRPRPAATFPCNRSRSSDAGTTAVPG